MIKVSMPVGIKTVMSITCMLIVVKHAYRYLYRGSQEDKQPLLLMHVPCSNVPLPCVVYHATRNVLHYLASF